MTEHNHSSAMDEENSQQPKPTIKKRRSGIAGIILGAMAIIIALIFGGWLYHDGKHQASAQTAVSDDLSNQLSALKKQQAIQKDTSERQLKQQASELDTAAKQQAELTRRLNEVQQKVTAISGSDAKTWLLAQADFLVKLAGHKLWGDQDVVTAATLLKSADASLADMNDPSLIAVRRALNDDIASLSTVTQVDYDGIILKLNQLSNDVDNLRLADNDTDDSPMDADSNELSGSLLEWRQNLIKSWHSFMDNFITLRRRDETAVPLLAPNQDIYLRENIRSRLLIAAQAVPRHQNETYKQSLDNVSTWVRAYYDTDDSVTKAFLNEVDSLSQQNINMDIPQTLESQPLLEKLMQTRVRNLLAQPSATATSNTPKANDPVQMPALKQGE